MRRIEILSLVVGVVLLGASGCSTQNKSDADALQGTWKGQEMGAHTEGTCSLVVSGKDLEFHGANSNEWYKATFTLREDTNPKQLLGTITECPAAKYVGKSSCAIYQLEGGALTLAALGPGNPAVPSSFEAAGVRRFVFKGK